MRSLGSPFDAARIERNVTELILIDLVLLGIAWWIFSRRELGAVTAVATAPYSSSSGSGPFGSESTGQLGRNSRSRSPIAVTRAAFSGALATLFSS